MQRSGKAFLDVYKRQGLIHSSVVLCVGALHGGLNLYNNGFSAGLVCIILIPLIEVFQKEKGI